MRLDKRVKDLFRYVGLRSQSLADPTLSYGVACRGEEPHWVRRLGCGLGLPIAIRPRTIYVRLHCLWIALAKRCWPRVS
jgi:hypothetical protein